MFTSSAGAYMKKDKKATTPIPKNEALEDGGVGAAAGLFAQAPVDGSGAYPAVQRPHLVSESERHVRQLAALHGVFPAAQVSPAAFLTNPVLHIPQTVSAVVQTAQLVTLQVAKAVLHSPLSL